MRCITLGLLAAAPHVFGQTCTQEDSVVKIVASNKGGSPSKGSGFVFDRRGYLVTNAHVVRDLPGPNKHYYQNIKATIERDGTRSEIPLTVADDKSAAPLDLCKEMAPNGVCLCGPDLVLLKAAADQWQKHAPSWLCSVDVAFYASADYQIHQAVDARFVGFPGKDDSALPFTGKFTVMADSDIRSRFSDCLVKPPKVTMYRSGEKIERGQSGSPGFLKDSRDMYRDRVGAVLTMSGTTDVSEAIAIEATPLRQFALEVEEPRVFSNLFGDASWKESDNLLSRLTNQELILLAKEIKKVPAGRRQLVADAIAQRGLMRELVDLTVALDLPAGLTRTALTAAVTLAQDAASRGDQREVTRIAMLGRQIGYSLTTATDVDPKVTHEVSVLASLRRDKDEQRQWAVATLNSETSSAQKGVAALDIADSYALEKKPGLAMYYYERAHELNPKLTTAKPGFDAAKWRLDSETARNTLPEEKREALKKADFGEAKALVEHEAKAEERLSRDKFSRAVGF